MGPLYGGVCRRPSGCGETPTLKSLCSLLPILSRMQALQCDVSVEEDNRQEWTFTLYDFDNSGKVTREVT